MDHLIFFATLFVLLLLIIYLDAKHDLLRDIGASSEHKSFSYSRVQLTWWTWIIVTSFVSVLYANDGTIPILDDSTLILLGISVGTTSLANIIDVSDAGKNRLQNDPSKNLIEANDATKTRHQSDEGRNLLYDILDDSNGVSIHRLQAVLFNIIFGIWMLTTVYCNMDCIPAIDNTGLVLLGISAGTYSAIKTSENKPPNEAPSKQQQDKRQGNDKQ